MTRQPEKGIHAYQNDSENHYHADDCFERLLNWKTVECPRQKPKDNRCNDYPDNYIDKPLTRDRRKENFIHPATQAESEK